MQMYFYYEHIKVVIIFVVSNNYIIYGFLIRFFDQFSFNFFYIYSYVYLWQLHPLHICPRRKGVIKLTYTTTESK